MIPVCQIHEKTSQTVESSTKLWGYIDVKGNLLISPQFKAACFFSSHLAYVRDQEGLVGFIDERGEWVIKPKYFDSLGFWAGWASVAQVKKPDQTLKWGVIDTLGATKIDFLFDFIGPFNNGLARAQIDGKWGYINIEGKWSIEPTYDWAGDIIDGIARVQTVTSNLETGYIRIDNLSGLSCPIAIQGGNRLTLGEDFSEGLAAVKQDDLWGYINQEGQWILKPQFVEAGDFIGGQMPVLTPNGWRLCDKNGTFVSKQYVQLESASCGLSRFFQHEKWGFINQKGIEIIPAKFDEISDFCQGYAIGIHEGQFIVINTKGEFVWIDEVS
jgi:hypothetical protein